MNKLQLTGQNLGRAGNSRRDRVYAIQLHFSETKQTNLKLITWNKQLLGYLIIDIVLPYYNHNTLIVQASILRLLIIIMTIEIVVNYNDLYDHDMFIAHNTLAMIVNDHDSMFIAQATVANDCKLSS